MIGSPDSIGLYADPVPPTRVDRLPVLVRSVMTAAPLGFQTLQIFEGLRRLADGPRLFEITRPLAGSLELQATELGLSRPGSTVPAAFRVNTANARGA